MENACSPAGARVLREEMDDLESRKKTGITQLDRKIQALSSLRDKWYETENILQQVNGELKTYEVELARLETNSENPSDAKKWYEDISTLEQKVLPLESLLIKSEDAIIQLEEHTESSTTLEARAANLRARWEGLRDSAKSLISYGTELVTAGQRAQTTIQNVQKNIEIVRNIYSQIDKNEISQPSEVNSIKEQNQRAGLLLDAAKATLGTIHLRQIGPTQIKDVEKSIADCEAEIKELQERHYKMKDDLNECLTLWVEFEENFRKLQHFIDRASYFDDPNEKISIDPMKWKSETVSIKALLEEKDPLLRLPASLETQINKISQLCNCESDNIRTKTATMEILLVDLPMSMQARLDAIAKLEQIHS